MTHNRLTDCDADAPPVSVPWPVRVLRMGVVFVVALACVAAFAAAVSIGWNLGR